MIALTGKTKYLKKRNLISYKYGQILRLIFFIEFKNNSTNSKPSTYLQLQIIKISHEMPD